MSIKVEFVEKARKRHANMAALCREFGISRETGYKWLRRYQKDGYDGLEELSRRPNASPMATAEQLVIGTLEMREAHPRWGPKKLRILLQRRFGEATPSEATIARILRRAGKARQRSRFRRLSIPTAAPNVAAASCNEIWTVDFKGWWRSGDGRRCEPLTVRDAYSRFILAIKVLASPSLGPTKAVFEGLFRRYGVPEAIQCDNGSPFICVRSRGGLTRLSAWWVSLGIKVIRSRPGCPQDNGGHERMHRDMASDLQFAPSSSATAQQRACDRWRLEFNHVRPHDALDGKVPSEIYKRSDRRAQVRIPIYPSQWIARRVAENGRIKVKDVSYRVGKSLYGHRVALEILDPQTGRLWFHNVELGTVKIEIADAEVDEAAEIFLERKMRKAS